MVSRVAVIDRNLCIREKCGYICEKVCPANRMGDECIITEEESRFPVISEQLCIGCGICVKRCPVSCIKIINLKEEVGEPLYQYGINTFRLYGLPLPKEGAIGLIGKNGIGKTTSMRVLTRQLLPNFANFGRRLSEKEMLERLPIEIRRYYSRVGTELKVSYKPQYIEKIRKVFSGTVRTLLEKTNERGKEALKETIAKFELQEILDRDIKHLSGGELQKVAIAAACLKDATIYYFDEITNYLDIRERLKTGVLLKELSEKKYTMIAEHDLAILDYLSDYIYIFYGDENAYGIVSGLKNVRAGINEYLSGFLKAENIRFRDQEIKFSKYSSGEVKTPVKINYSALEKSFNSFRFSSEGGSIREGEIIGIVGKNALGKSLFIKMLAGVEKPDKGVGGQFRVSYKPQYITTEDVEVKAIFENAKNLDRFVLEECKRRLLLALLWEKKLTELSGGELQRVAIAMALSQEAELYLFDEPTAFLDIEQRLIFSELLRAVIEGSKKSAFVVDHDVVFIDSIAHRLIVFDGKSSVHGHASTPLTKHEGMNSFLKLVDITMRRDRDSNRPRINKPDSALDREQKEANEYYYAPHS